MSYFSNAQHNMRNTTNSDSIVGRKLLRWVFFRWILKNYTLHTSTVTHSLRMLFKIPSSTWKTRKWTKSQQSSNSLIPLCGISCFSEADWCEHPYLELSLLCEEVFEQHQHVWGHCGHIGGKAVGPVTVAEASAHGVVDKQHTGCLHLQQPTHMKTKHISMLTSFIWADCNTVWMQDHQQASEQRGRDFNTMHSIIQLMSITFCA